MTLLVASILAVAVGVALVALLVVRLAMKVVWKLMTFALVVTVLAAAGIALWAYFGGAQPSP